MSPYPRFLVGGRVFHHGDDLPNVRRGNRVCFRDPPLMFEMSPFERYPFPTDFWSNGASVFRIVWFLLGHPLDAKNILAGHAHDFWVTPDPTTGKLPVSREKAAKLFRAALKCQRKSRLGRAAEYVAVFIDAQWRRIASWFGHGKEYA